MSDNVIKIVSKPKADTVNHDLAAMLEELLGMVKEGEIVALSYAAVKSDGIGSMGWNWGGDGGPDFALLGMTSVMHGAFTAEFD